MTYNGHRLAFKTNHVSSQKIQNALPFRSSTIRLPEYRLNERKMSPFVGPSNYASFESFVKLHKSPCPTKIVQDSAGPNPGNRCVNMIGHARVYIPAFEKPQERRKLVEQTKDLGYRPRAGITPGLSSSSLGKTSVVKDMLSSRLSKKNLTTTQKLLDQASEPEATDACSTTG